MQNGMSLHSSTGGGGSPKAGAESTLASVTEVAGKRRGPWKSIPKGRGSMFWLSVTKVKVVSMKTL